jgi:outer membrane protein assembly factor BamD
MYIARFYMKKSKWISAIKRLKIVINDYDTTIYSEEALHRLVEIYYKLGNIKEAKKYGAILGYNFNDGNWYKKTYKIVADRNYKLE